MAIPSARLKDDMFEMCMGVISVMKSYMDIMNDECCIVVSV